MLVKLWELVGGSGVQIILSPVTPDLDQQILSRKRRESVHSSGQIGAFRTPPILTLHTPLSSSLMLPGHFIVALAEFYTLLSASCARWSWRTGRLFAYSSAKTFARSGQCKETSARRSSKPSQDSSSWNYYCRLLAPSCPSLPHWKRNLLTTIAIHYGD